MERKVYLAYDGDEIELGTVEEILATEGTSGLDTARVIWIAVMEVVSAIFYGDDPESSASVTISIR